MGGWIGKEFEPCLGAIRSCTAWLQAASAFAIHLFAWVRLVPASGRFRNCGESERSMSSENLWMTPKTFDSDVPPLKTSSPANSVSKRMPSNQQTQKSFSMITGERLLRIAACSDIDATFGIRQCQEFELHTSSPASSRKIGCIHAGASRMSLSSSRRLLAGMVRLR